MYSEAALQKKVWFDESALEEVVSGEDTTYHLREMREERRSTRRHTVREGTYAVIESIYPQICQIMDIGSGGLSIVYFKNEEMVDFKVDKLDIVVLGDGFCLENILFEKVGDYKIGEQDACGFEKRVANIRFMETDEDTQGQIRKFIRNYHDKTVN